MTMWPLLIPTAMPAIVASFDYLMGASRRREAGGEMSAIVSDAGGDAEDERIVFVCTSGPSSQSCMTATT